MKLKVKKYFIIFASAVLLLCIAAAVIGTLPKEIITRYPAWVGCTFAEAVENADTIVYGTVTGKSRTHVIKSRTSDPNITFTECWRDVKIDVERCLKGTPERTAAYREAGGKTLTKEYVYHGHPIADNGDKVLVFIRENSPVSILAIIFETENGILNVSNDMLPDSFPRSDMPGALMTDVPLESYLDAIADTVG